MRAICTLVTRLPASAETYWHLGKPIIQYIRTLSDIASACSLAVTRGSFLANVHRELSVAVVHIQGWVYRSCALLPANAADSSCCQGRTCPSLIELSVVLVASVSWLCLFYMRLRVCTFFQVRRLVSLLCRFLCLLPTPLSRVTATSGLQVCATPSGLPSIISAAGYMCVEQGLCTSLVAMWNHTGSSRACT
jgi:hypothetical protein